ncbi:uncharacterized protein METZ01_LOCUS485282, partial [marine metagenome]
MDQASSMQPSGCPQPESFRDTPDGSVSARGRT